jgi:hypothetical protein
MDMNERIRSRRGQRPARAPWEQQALQPKIGGLLGRKKVS